jgi:hypothetical protein
MIVARLIRIEFPQTLWQIETQNLAETARRVARRDQLIGEEGPERLFLGFELWQAQMFQIDLREAFVALRPKRRRMPQFDEQNGIDRRRKGATASSARMRSSPERSSLPASPPPRRIGATQVPAPSMRPA